MKLGFLNLYSFEQNIKLAFWDTEIFRMARYQLILETTMLQKSDGSQDAHRGSPDTPNEPSD